MKSFKQFLDEDMPNAGGQAPMPNPGAPVTPVPSTNSGANSAQMQQSQNLGMQIQQMNQKLQKLMQQKAQLDKQIGQANTTTNASANTNGATVTATQGAPGQ